MEGLLEHYPWFVMLGVVVIILLLARYDDYRSWKAFERRLHHHPQMPPPPPPERKKEKETKGSGRKENVSEASSLKSNQ